MLSGKRDVSAFGGDTRRNFQLFFTNIPGKTPGHDGVDFVAFFAFEVVAVHPVVFFRMADDRLNAASPSLPLTFASHHALSFLVGKMDFGAHEDRRYSLHPLSQIS